MTCTVFLLDSADQKLWPINFIPWVYSQRNGYMCALKIKYKNVHSSIIHSNKKFETTRTSFNSEWITIVDYNMKYHLATKILFIYLKKHRRFTTWSEGSHLIWFHLYKVWASQVVLVVKNLPANTGDARDMDSIPGSGRSLGGGHGNPLQ